MIYAADPSLDLNYDLTTTCFEISDGAETGKTYPQWSAILMYYFIWPTKKTWSCLMFGAQVVSQSTTSHPSSFCRASKVQAGYCFAAPFVAWFVQQKEVLECAWWILHISFQWLIDWCLRWRFSDISSLACFKVSSIIRCYWRETHSNRKNPPVSDHRKRICKTNT